MRLWGMFEFECRAALRTQSNIQDGVFCKKSKQQKTIFAKNSILDVRLCSEYASRMTQFLT